MPTARSMPRTPCPAGPVLRRGRACPAGTLLVVPIGGLLGRRVGVANEGYASACAAGSPGRLVAWPGG
eukprot:3509144-Alexandrium_andersonii.AAC.1